MERGIARQLRAIYGFNHCQVKKIDIGVMNDNFLVKTEKGNFLFKRYRRKTPVEIRQDWRLLQYLHKLGFPVPVPQVTKNKKEIAIFLTGRGLLYKYIDGKIVNRLSIDQLEEVGKILGQMHRRVAVVSLPGLAKKQIWELKELKNMMENITTVEKTKMIFLSWLRREIDNFHFDRLPSGFTHQDVKAENIVISKGKVKGLLDFDNSQVATFLSDLTTTTIWSCFDRRGQLNIRRLVGLLRGYNVGRKLNKNEKKIFFIYLRFRLLREVFICQYVSQKKKQLVKRRARYFRNLYIHLAESEGKEISKIMENI